MGTHTDGYAVNRSGGIFIQRVLLFPPVNSYARFLIHQTCDTYRQQYDLITFSVGQGPHRRTVVCFRSQLLDPQGFEIRKQQRQQHQHQSQYTPVRGWRSNGYNTLQQYERSSSMGIKKHIETRLSKSNSVDIYRPPALRNNSVEEATSTASITNETPATTKKTATTTTSAKAATSIVGTGNAALPHSDELKQQQSSATAATRRERRRPDRAVYVPRARRSQTTPPTTTTAPATATATGTALATATTSAKAASVLPTTCNSHQLEVTVADTNSSRADERSSQYQKSKKEEKKEKKKHRERIKKSTVADKCNQGADATTLFLISSNKAENTKQFETGKGDSSRNCDKDELCAMNINGNGTSQTKPDKGTKTSNNGSSTPALRIEDVAATKNAALNAEDATKCDNDVRELQRASKEINRSNRRIMKQTFVSDVLEIPDKIVTSAIAAPNTEKTIPPADSTTEGEDDDDDDGDQDEDNWENMYDESGECLDPKILQDLSDCVGKFKIELPKMDYNVYHIKQSLLNDDEFPHVLEVSNFPVEFKTPDLLMLFSQYKGSGFDIKWVDDTHALAVFSSSRIAAEVLTMGHPFVKLKPLCEASQKSRLKAKGCSLQPYRQRPETCTALARRLVSGALGVKLPTAPQERENERRVLREAKERKLLAAKQRDEAWES